MFDRRVCLLNPKLRSGSRAGASSRVLNFRDNDISFPESKHVFAMLRIGRAATRTTCTTLRHSFSSAACLHAKPPLPPRPTVNEDEITEVFLKGSGPGGQKINKTSSAVQLKHLPTGIVVKSQDTRSRSQNRKIARRILAEKLEVLEKGDESRVAKKAERAKVKKVRASKKTNRKYKKLDEEKEATVRHNDRGATDLDVLLEETAYSGDPDHPATAPAGTISRRSISTDNDFRRLAAEEQAASAAERAAAEQASDPYECEDITTAPGISTDDDFRALAAADQDSYDNEEPRLETRAMRKIRELEEDGMLNDDMREFLEDLDDGILVEDVNEDTFTDWDKLEMDEFDGDEFDGDDF